MFTLRLLQIEKKSLSKDIYLVMPAVGFCQSRAEASGRISFNIRPAPPPKFPDLTGHENFVSFSTVWISLSNKKATPEN